MLLWSAEGKSDPDIARLFGVTLLAVATKLQRWVIQKRIADAPKPGRHKRLDARQEAYLVALACSDAPEGRESWTLQLVADRLLELKAVETPITYQTVRETLRKTNLSLPPAEAYRILSRLEFHRTPKHACWRNMVETELSVLEGVR